MHGIDAKVLREALHQASSYIMVTDENLIIRYCNRVANGFTFEEVIGRKHGYSLPPDQQRKLERALELARQTGEVQLFEGFADPPADGRRWYTVQISAYTASDGSSGAISIITDITRQRVAEMQAESLRRELMEASHRAGIAEVASGVLHNVGNVLNSVNVSADVIAKELESSRLYLLGRALAMLEEQADDVVGLFTRDPKGRKLPALLGKLAKELEAERLRLRAELSRLRDHLQLIGSIIKAQHGLAKLGDMAVLTRPDELVHRTLTMFHLDIEHRGIALRLELADVGSVLLDEQAALQVLANLIRNAIEALEVVERPRELVIRLHADGQKLHFDVEDNGCGISPEDHAKLFRYGFTTKPNGHGFGLGASAIAARTMNGVLEAHSEGADRGARFRLTLPKIH